MTKSRLSVFTFIAILSLVGALRALGAEKKKQPAKAAAPAAAAPSEEEMTKAWMAAATPGEAHKKLEPVVGTFTTKTTATMVPGKPPEVTEGLAENKWVLGGRFLEQHFDGKAMGQPFSGIGYTGYDNYKKKYVGTWIDTMSTSTMISTCTMDAEGKTMTCSSTVDDVIMKKPQKIKSIMKIADADHHSFEMWGPGPDGKNAKMLEVEYTRKK